MICPKCALEQTDASECARCGVIVARYRRPTSPSGRTPVERPEPPPREGRRRRSFIEWLGLAAMLALVTVWVVRRDRARPAPETLPHTVARKAEVATSRPLVTVTEPTPPSVAMSARAAEANPTASAPPEILPAAACPLADHGFGAPPSRGRVSSDWYTNPSDLQQAFSEQESAAVPLVVYVYTDWCPYCHAFERGLLTSSAVDQYLRDNAVKLRVNPENSREGAVLTHRLGATGYPTFIVCIPGDTPQPVSIYEQGSQLKAPQEFINAIEGRVARGAGRLVQAGRRARETGDVRESIRLLTLVIRMKAGEPQAYLERALSLAQSGATDEALDDIARVARDRPDEILAYQAADSLLGRLGRWDEVIGCWTGVLEHPSLRGRAYLARSRALERKGLRGLSRSDADKACALGESEGCRPASLL